MGRPFVRSLQRCHGFPKYATEFRQRMRRHLQPNLRKQAMGLLGREVFVPQSYQFGGEAQVDWYEAWADFHPGSEDLSPGTPKVDGQRRKVYIFCMRSMASGAAFHRAYASLMSRLQRHFAINPK